MVSKVGNLFGVALLSVLPWLSLAPEAAGAELHGVLKDADSGAVLAGRIYLQSADGEWRHVRSSEAGGIAIPYDVRRFERSWEVHTTVSAHGWIGDVPEGESLLTAERGTEYLPAQQQVLAREGRRLQVELRLQRWCDPAERGWFSGDTHVHRTVEDLRQLVLAEDLNVALPLTYWVTRSGTAPLSENKAGMAPDGHLIEVDSTHVIYPVNTEYEIFTVDSKQHTLGAVFVLNHQEPLPLGVPPVRPVAEEARRQGALLELDKHNWPWSMMLVPVMEVDLFELSNNHVWRTEFGFRDWRPVAAPDFMEVESGPGGWTERGWIDFGLKTYALLLNCGFRMRPAAGTASGVHPVPLGFSRVYVQMPDGKFDFGEWMRGLDAGRSFVTTGPMLYVSVDGALPGSQLEREENSKLKVRAEVESADPIESIEVVRNGETVHRIDGASAERRGRAWVLLVEYPVEVATTSWLAVRCFARRDDGRVRFAHSGPVWVEVPGRPLRPAKREAEWLVGRMEAELERNRGILDAASMAEYEEALATFQEIVSPPARVHDKKGKTP